MLSEPLPASKGPPRLEKQAEVGRSMHRELQEKCLYPQPPPQGGETTRPHMSDGTPNSGEPVGAESLVAPSRWPALSMNTCLFYAVATLVCEE